MAVTTTPRNIINWAYGKSLKNVPGAIATESDELLNLVVRAMRGIYAVAARINPQFFAETAVVAFNAPGWARPQAAESIFRIENPGLVEVIVVPHEDKTAEPGIPAVFQFAQIYRSAGNASDPVAGNLTFFYSKRPTTPATLDTTLDALWVEQFNELLVLIVALYLAEKDGRADEVAGLIRDIDKWSRAFVAFLEHETVNMRRRTGHIRRFNTQTLVPIMSILTGKGDSISA